MADPDRRAKDLIIEADKKLTSGRGFLASMFGSGSKEEEALEMYQKAANMFKMSKNWEEAGKTFVKVANLQQKVGNSLEAATNFVHASNSYKKVNSQETISCLLKAIDIQTDMGRFIMAAKNHQTIGEIYETEFADFENSMKHFEQAADYFQGEESNASARNCLLKVGDQAAVMKNYDKAIGIFEKVATKALDDKLSQYSAKDYFFRAAICRLCNSSESSEAALEANLAIQRYEQQYPAFQDSREYKLIKDIASALEEQNKEQFVNKLQDFDSISRLNPWQTKLLNRVKELFNDEEDLK